MRQRQRIAGALLSHAGFQLLTPQAGTLAALTVFRDPRLFVAFGYPVVLPVQASSA